ncbi:MAG TPA: galactose-1-phosphate uridylyltransferase [Candidatus Deferrimicrobium sp.]|nr:galactose-1-phosphate uridylyltransferase [Candidatus Deferrimicrobium sp.]
MAELRWNPLLRTWTMVAGNRQARPNLRTDGCPFCPGSGSVPSTYDVLEYDNDFPALTTDPDEPDAVGSELSPVAPNYGKCEVILYSPQHDASLHDLSIAHLTRLVELWTERQRILSSDPRIKYIFPFENRGEEVGVTMRHPHGQLYAYPFVPLKIRTELDSAYAWHGEHGSCMFCDLTRDEMSDGRRIILANESFVAYIPSFTDYPYGVFVTSRVHKGSFLDFTPSERTDLARMLKTLTGGFDLLFARRFPYMMCIHQTPVNSPEDAGCEDSYHFHIEFYPPLRGETTVKYYASSEMGAWAACNPLRVEDTAPALAAACRKFEQTIVKP